MRTLNQLFLPDLWVVQIASFLDHVSEKREEVELRKESDLLVSCEKGVC